MKRKRTQPSRQWTVELAAINRQLKQESILRKKAEKALEKCELANVELTASSHSTREELRHITHTFLSALEDERQLISRELHDQVAQTLSGINVYLAALRAKATMQTEDFDQSFIRTQKLVEKSVGIVMQFARELRPAALDDLGLIPALHFYMKTFTARTGVPTRLTTFAKVEQLDTASRTALFRVAQEALTNVARHARADLVEVNIFKKAPDQICMKIIDNGKSFRVNRKLNSHNMKHLGLIGMRERVEMVGGSFEIESVPGEGTTIIARVPFGRATKQGKLRRNQSKAMSGYL